MASPYGHVLVGLGLVNLCYPRWITARNKTLLLYGLVVLGACSPDLDFLPGIFLGNPSLFHHGLFHSLGMAVGLSLSAGALIALFGKGHSIIKISGFVFILIFSHLVLDFFTEDLKPPFGFMLFWPLSGNYYLSPWSILPHVERNFSNPVIWSQILRVFLVESLLFLPFFLYFSKGELVKRNVFKNYLS
jgi:membrane-bound metal-dependent hydrolase YbcI (DUF457 family)